MAQQGTARGALSLVDGHVTRIALENSLLNKSHRSVVSTCVLLFMPYLKKKEKKTVFFKKKKIHLFKKKK